MKNLWFCWFFNLLNIAGNILKFRYSCSFSTSSDFITKSGYKTLTLSDWIRMLIEFAKKPSKTDKSRDRY